MEHTIKIRTVTHAERNAYDRNRKYTIVTGYPSHRPNERYHIEFEGWVDKELAAHWAIHLFENEGA